MSSGGTPRALVAGHSGESRKREAALEVHWPLREGRERERELRFASDPLSQSTDYDLLQAEVTTGWYQEYHPRSISFSRPLPPSLLLWALTPSFLFHLSWVLPGGRGDSLLISHSAPHPSSAGPCGRIPGAGLVPLRLILRWRQRMTE